MNKLSFFFVLTILFVGISCTQNNPMEPEWIEEEFEVQATLVSSSKEGKFPGMSLISNRNIRHKNKAANVKSASQVKVNNLMTPTPVSTGFNVVVEQFETSKAVSGLILPTDEKAAEKVFLNDVQWPIKLEPVRTRGRNNQLTVFKTQRFREAINPESKQFFFTLVFFDEKGETIIKEDYVVDLTEDQRGRFRTLAEEVNETGETSDSTNPQENESSQEAVLPVKSN
jgi:hypothetical protein